MNKFRWHPMVALTALLALVSAVEAQRRPYIGFCHPAGGQQGATFQITIGGDKALNGVNEVFISGEGVQGKVVEYKKHLDPQEMILLMEQLNDLKKGSAKDAETQKLIAKLQQRLDEYVNRVQSVSIANVVVGEVTIAANAKPGERELRLATPAGLSNPLVFNVSQLPEVTSEPMLTTPEQVLGKEEESLRRGRRRTAKKSSSEMMMDSAGSQQAAMVASAVRIEVPSVVNGQIASGEVDRYRFTARKGQRLVISAQSRQLVPYIADAVPGWCQAVLALYDSKGSEVAYDDDYRFKPDPVIFFDVPKDGDYVFAIYDSIYRGREDFVYRVTIGELPFVTTIFPLGGRVDTPVTVAMKGWNLPETKLTPSTKDAEAGIYPIAVRKEGFVSNRVLFALDTLPESFDAESNNTLATAQKVKLPIIINGRIDKPADWDVFQFEGHAGDEIVAEVLARQLDSPLDSVLRLTDAAGKQLAFNDDREYVLLGQHLGTGLNTHHADSYIRIALPADGTYYLYLGDIQRSGGEEYGYRLRISGARPDFELRAVPSSVSIRSGSSASVTVYAVRKDGFTGDISVGLRDAPPGISSYGDTMSGTQLVAQISVRSDLSHTERPLSLTVEGRATIWGKEVVREAVPAEDRMQAFLWRHLVPAQDMQVFVFDPSELPARRVGKRGNGK